MKKDFVKIEGNSELSRDMATRAVINTDRNALDKARARKRKVLDEKAKITELEEKVDKLTELLTKLLENKDLN